jgi:hypothetical protein
MSLRRTVALVALCLALSSLSAYAQSLGTFRWQLQGAVGDSELTAIFVGGV